MKEKIIKILESQFSVVEYEDPDTGFTESTTIDVLTTDEFPDIVDKLEILVNQEVERRIKERMPSEVELVAERDKPRLRGDEVYENGFKLGFYKACLFYRSRLTQKTEGGGE